MFKEDKRGRFIFIGGKNVWEKAAKVAKKCDQFRLDVEEERVADQETSCYNCRYRRWTADSFICLGKR